MYLCTIYNRNKNVNLMNDDQRIAKNSVIRDKGIATRERHKSMRCRVITAKIVENKISKEQKESLYGQFREAKWVYNDILSRSKNGTDIFTLTYKDFDTVTHLDKDGNPVTDELIYLSKRQLQSVIAGVKENISNLAKAKKKGKAVGSLRFISEYRAIDLAQYEKSYRVISTTKVKVDKIRKPLYVRGLKQLDNLAGYEFANAKLIMRPDGIFIGITVYEEKEEKTGQKPLLGIDMGCETSLTLSNGEKINLSVRETERLKRLQRRLERSKKGSSNRWRLRRRLRKEHLHMQNMRDDMARKVLHMLSSYMIVMQDEQLQAWQASGHGKKISHGVLGRVKDALMERPDTYVISKWVPTTKMCRECGEKVELSQQDRVFRCPHCGAEGDRDVHAAENMLWFFGRKETLCVGRTEYNREDFENQIRVIFPRTIRETAKSLVER